MKQVISFNNKNVELPEPYVIPYAGFKVTAIEDSTVVLTNVGGNRPNVKYSTNNGLIWTVWDYTTISIPAGKTICFKDSHIGASDGFNKSDSKYSRFDFSGKVKLSGNICSLLDGGDGSTITNINAQYCFCNLFRGSNGNDTSIIDAGELTLGATSISNIRVCNYMFANCKAMTTPPQLPATSLAADCYYAMFETCKSLTTIPNLPATTIPQEGYAAMFIGCTSLTSVELNFTSWTGSYPFWSMFKACSSLNYIKCNKSNAITGGTNWVQGVAATGTFIKKPGSNWSTGVNGIPSGWTVIESND